MLDSFNLQTLSGITVFADDTAFDMFYLYPTEPRWRVDERKIPLVKFYLYRDRVDRPDGPKGGWLLFDTEFVVPDEKRAEIAAALQVQVNSEAQRRGIDPAPTVSIQEMAFTEAKCSINLSDEGSSFFERITNPGRPSKYGRRVASWSIEMSEQGAALVDAALRGTTGASIASVTYEMHWLAALPPMTVTGTFNAEKFYSFTQTVDVDWDLWGEDSYRKSVSQRLRQSESTKVEVNPGGFAADPANREVVDKVREWAQRSLEDSIERRMMLKMEPPTEDQLKAPDGIEDSTISFRNHQIDSFSVTHTEKVIVEDFDLAQGTLPTIGSLTDTDGNPLDPDKFIEMVDLNHPFFKTVRVNAKVNADFEGMPIHSVEVRMDYDGEPMLLVDEDEQTVGVDGEFAFDSTDDVARFIAAKIDGVNTYTYSYSVNYRNEAKKLEAGPFTVPISDSIQTIGVSEAGVLDIAVLSGDLNFSLVKSAHVVLTYTDPSHGITTPLERHFDIDANHREHRWQEVIFVPRAAPYHYKTKFTMEDGSVFTREGTSSSDVFYTDDPFTLLRIVSVRSFGDFTDDIRNITVTLTYREPANNYVRTTTIAINQDNLFADWTVPVIDESKGVLSYSWDMELVNDPPKTQPETVSEDWVIRVGRRPFEEAPVQFIADLLDFTQIKLVKVDIHYEDPADATTIRNSLVFRAPPSSQTIQLKSRDGSRPTFNWAATFFMADSTRRSTTPVDSTDEVIVLELPAA
jgi:hypothetical protein